MSMQFDSTLKVLLEAGPGDWLRFLGHPAKHASLIDADISTVSGAADKVILVEDEEEPRIEHLEFQAGPDKSKPRKMNVYNSVLEDRHGLDVRTTLILLRKQANLSVYNGVYTRTLPNALKPYRTFEYNVVKVWELSPNDLLQSIATMPLALIANTPESQLPEIIHGIKQQMALIPDPGFVAQLWTSTNVLLGLKYDDAFIRRLLQEVQRMEESTTWQAIVASGRPRHRLEEAVHFLMRIGRVRFGAEPDPATLSRIQSLRTADEVEALGERVLLSQSWDEALELPQNEG